MAGGEEVQDERGVLVDDGIRTELVHLARAMDVAGYLLYLPAVALHKLVNGAVKVHAVDLREVLC